MAGGRADDAFGAMACPSLAAAGCMAAVEGLLGRSGRGPLRRHGDSSSWVPLGCRDSSGRRPLACGSRAPAGAAAGGPSGAEAKDVVAVSAEAASTVA